MTAWPDTHDWLRTLMAFDTTSRNSNLHLIEHVRDALRGLGVGCELFHSPARDKANLFATLPAAGGQCAGGIVLSGHTDVVPVDGQDWASDPFTLLHQAGRLYGRGSCDMKGFIAVALALVPHFLALARTKPLHLALSYDEEVGCMGAPLMIDALKHRGARFDGCVVGEPTSMQVVVAHKGTNLYRCRVHGCAAHSSLTPSGSNAIEYAARLICRIRDMADAFKAQGPYDHFFDVPFTTLTTNQIQGGIAANTIPDLCEFVYEFRNLPGMEAQAIQARIEAWVQHELLPRMRREFADARIDMACEGSSPALQESEDAAITALARALSGDRQPHRKVAYGTEAGLFHNAGIPAVVCGPGSIAQAHKPNEFVEASQLHACEAFLRKLGQALC